MTVLPLFMILLSGFFLLTQLLANDGGFDYRQLLALDGIWVSLWRLREHRLQLSSFGFFCFIVRRFSSDQLSDGFSCFLMLMAAWLVALRLAACLGAVDFFRCGRRCYLPCSVLLFLVRFSLTKPMHSLGLVSCFTTICVRADYNC